MTRAVNDPQRGRSGRPYWRLRAAVLKPGAVCWLCGRGIRFDLPPRTPWSPSLDHVRPLSKGGDPLAIENARPAHLCCNASRGNRPPVFTRPDRQSEQW